MNNYFTLVSPHRVVRVRSASFLSTNIGADITLENSSRVFVLPWVKWKSLKLFTRMQMETSFLFFKSSWLNAWELQQKIRIYCWESSELCSSFLMSPHFTSGWKKRNWQIENRHWKGNQSVKFLLLWLLPLHGQQMDTFSFQKLHFCSIVACKMQEFALKH